MTYAYCLGAGDEFLGNYSTVEEALEVARKDAKIKIKMALTLLLMMWVPAVIFTLVSG